MPDPNERHDWQPLYMQAPPFIVTRNLSHVLEENDIEGQHPDGA